METLEVFKARGGYVARVPNDSTTLMTRPKEIRQTDGRMHVGPEILQTEIVLEGDKPTRVVRFSSLSDFRNFARADLAWQKINESLHAEAVAKLCHPNQRPGAIVA